jgi:hypothetical protein
MRPLLPVLRDLTSWLTRGVAVGALPGSLLAVEIDQERQSAAAEANASPSAEAAAKFLTWSACGHLNGLLRLLGAKGEEPHPHALASLARGAIENAALAAWLADSGINGEERSRRFASYQHYGLIERAKLAVDTDGLDQMVLALTATAERRGWKLALPPKTALVARLFKDEKFDPGDASGAFGYRVLSAIAHGSFHTLLEFLHPVGDDGVLIGASGKQAFTLCILPATLAVQLLGYELVATFGLSAEEWSDIIRRCREVDVGHLMDTTALMDSAQSTGARQVTRDTARPDDGPKRSIL